MEALAIISLFGNIVQFVDFSGRLIAKTSELYRSSESALAENIDAETAANHLVLLSNKINDATTSTSDPALKNLCESCKCTADELLAALNKLKVIGRQDGWKSIRKALRSVWNKERISELERRLEKLRAELNLHILVDLREQISQFGFDHLDRLKGIDLVTREVIGAVIAQKDVFKAISNTQIDVMETLHSKTVLRVKDEHETTRRKIIGEMASNIQAEHAGTRRIIQEIWMILAHFLAFLKSIVDLISRLCVSSQQIHNVLLEMKSALSLDTRWTFFQPPYYFEDALGRIYPIAFEYNFDLMRNIIKTQFEQMPGYRQVLLGNYELFRTRNPRQIISDTTHLRPGTAITMAILLNTPITGTEQCPIPDCRSMQCENSPIGGRTCDVAVTIGTSEYEWLTNDLLSISASNDCEGESQSYQIDDTGAFKNVKLSIQDRVYDDEKSLESALDDASCIFNPAGQVALIELSRNYFRGRLSAEDLGRGLDELFKRMGVETVTKWTIHQGSERRHDTFRFEMSF